MTLDGNDNMLFQMVKSQLGDSPSIEEVQSTVTAVAQILNLDQSTVTRVVNEFRSTMAPPGMTDYAPRLLVDWGELPRVGRQCRPEFSLVCPSYPGRPEIHLAVDRELDHDPVNEHVRPQSDGQSLWSFHVPFRMTSQGLDCRPGQYLIELQVAFREVPPGLPRFFRCRIRLNVPGASESEGGVLEIDGDGQSVVNLQGYDLRQFSKVVLKGGQDGVINLANSFGSPTPDPAPVTEKPSTTFEYQLKIDQQKQARLPTHFATNKPRASIDAAGFFFDDGRRSLVYARPKLTFGRSRDNDVVVRFLPRSEENDRHSGNISRTHFIAELTPEGIDLKDESRSGMEVNYSVVRDRHVVPSMFAGETVHVELGVTGTVPKKFEFEMHLFGPDRHEHRDEMEYWDDLVCEVVGGRLSRLARLALDTGVNAVRYDRITSLPGEESYVHLLREVLIGGSPGRCGVLLRESGSQTLARLLHIDRSFWLEPMQTSIPITLDGIPLAPQTLTALSPGMEIIFGSERTRFDRPVQLYLD
jgi:hypothetical protein